MKKVRSFLRAFFSKWKIILVLALATFAICNYVTKVSEEQRVERLEERLRSANSQIAQLKSEKENTGTYVEESSQEPYEEDEENGQEEPDDGEPINVVDMTQQNKQQPSTSQATVTAPTTSTSSKPQESSSSKEDSEEEEDKLTPTAKEKRAIKEIGVDRPSIEKRLPNGNLVVWASGGYLYVVDGRNLYLVGENVQKNSLKYYKSNIFYVTTGGEFYRIDKDLDQEYIDENVSRKYEIEGRKVRYTSQGEKETYVIE